jgi:hypothetical protein
MSPACAIVSVLACAYRFPSPRAARVMSMIHTISRDRGDASCSPACISHSSIAVAIPSARLIHTLYSSGPRRIGLACGVRRMRPLSHQCHRCVHSGTGSRWAPCEKKLAVAGGTNPMNRSRSARSIQGSQVTTCWSRMNCR